jgi:hypothetical protein
VIALDTMAGFMRSLASARQVALSSYTLHPGPVLGALEAAARRGAAVRVRLDGDPVGGAGGALYRSNAAAVAELRAAGADAALTGPDEPSMHLKAATVDGVTWLDDRNWIGSAAEQIVRTDEPGAVAMTKADALKREADVIERAGASELDVESESFGSGAIYGALLQRAAAHLPTRLIVAGREAAEPRNAAERTCLARLAALGVEVRLGDARGRDLNEKLAVSAGGAWVGSANATYDGGDFGAQRDWGVASGDPAIVDALRGAFARNWARASPLVRQ